ncbi:MAG: hypothetical protein M3O36_00685 [Myxococcota bacterium]|nr:hypothetical protein [Myxococcota bacterium]
MRTLVRTPAALMGTVVAGLAVSLGATIPLARGDAKPSTISVSEIMDGMKGYGLTVFKGTQPERFDVEVIGVLHHFRPGEELIVIKTPHPRLDVVKTVRGMSGSPIYIDGRLAGAYAYSLSSFEIEPVAGVTPIGPMLTEMRRPVPPGLWPQERGAPLPGRVGRSGANAIGGPPLRPDASVDRFDGPPGTYDLVTHAHQLEDRLGVRAESRSEERSAATMTTAATPLMMAGVSDRAAALLRTLLEPLGLEPLQGGGGSAVPDADTPKHFVNGGALGVQLARGDVSMMGLGTATYVDGAGRVAGFGHPMLNGGESAMPACIGRVLWVNASALASHKVGECARPLGTLVQDRQTAIVVDENLTAPTIPIDVEVLGAPGAPKTHWHSEITDDKFMAPGLAAVILGSVVEATTSERRDVTWRLATRVSVAGHGAIDLEDVGIASGGTPDAGEWTHSKLVTAVGDVLNNPWERTRIEKVEARFEIKYAHDLWRLRGVDLVEPVVDAGSKAALRLHLVPLDGPETTRVVEVTMPSELAGKDVEIEVVPGYDVARELAPPESLDDLLANEPRQTIAPRSLVVQFRVPSQGMAYRGHVTQRLPMFTLDALRPQNSNAGPEAFQSWSRTVVPMAWFVEGHDKTKVKVRQVVR